MENLRDRVRNITVWRRNGERAPHKPLLILLILGRLLRGEERLLPFREADKKLTELLVQFGPPRKSHHPEYPFWRLKNDDIWELVNTENIQTRASNTDAKKSSLLECDVQGGFLPPVHAAFKRNVQLVHDVITDLLDSNFPVSIHDDILSAVGIEMSAGRPGTAGRDPAFRNRVLRAYSYRCAICGYAVRLSEQSVGLEAAHIRWHTAGGPDIESNGLALCALHHKLFDRGAFSLDQALRIRVSQEANGFAGLTEWLLAFSGAFAERPQHKDYYPEKAFLKWHEREVFRGPARECAWELSAGA